MKDPALRKAWAQFSSVFIRGKSVSIRVPVTKINYKYIRNENYDYCKYKNRRRKDCFNALRTTIDEAEASGISPRSVDIA
jgi:hypothetical protein